MLRRLIHPLYRNLETSVHPLRYLFVEITQRCNLDCRHCGSDCTRESQLDELSTAEWLDLFSYLARNFDRRKLVLVVTGGEPFCCPSFDQILMGLKRNGLRWGMVTNGFALTEANLKKVQAAGIISMTISLDGLQEAHDWLRGRRDSFKRATAAVERVAKAGLPFFDVVTCVNPRNLGELDQVKALLEELGVPAWRLFSIFPKGRAAENNELLLSNAQLGQLMAWIRDRRADARPGSIELQFSCEGYVDRDLDRAVRQEPYFCRAGISIGSVLCDGAISGCPNISRELVQGNIRTDDLKEVWEQRFGPFRDRRWMQTGPCVGCTEWKRCRGNSMHLWNHEDQQTARCFHRGLKNSTS